VKVDGTYSEKIVLKWGVPQGSGLSPLLFLVYIADIDINFPMNLLVGYADDYNGSISSTDPYQVLKQTELMLQEMKNYFSRLGLSMNSKKTEFLMIRPSKDTKTYKLNFHGEEIIEKSQTKLLGVTITNDLCWNEHISNVCKIIRQRTGLIQRLKHKLEKPELTCITHGIIVSQVKYCLSVYATVRLNGDDPKNVAFDKIQILLNNIARIINGIKRTDHVSKEQLHKLSPWLSLNHMSVKSIILTLSEL